MAVTYIGVQEMEISEQGAAEASSPNYVGRARWKCSSQTVINDHTAATDAAADDAVSSV